MREGSDPRGTASLRFVLLYFTVYLPSIGNCGLQVQDRRCLRCKEVFVQGIFLSKTVDWENELIFNLLIDKGLTDD